MSSSSITEQVKALRQRAGLSVRGIAPMLGMSSSGYLHYETPARFKEGFLPMAFALKLAAALKPYGINEAEVLALATQAPRDPAELRAAASHGFSEDHALPWRGADDIGVSAGDMCRLLAPDAGNPGPYEIRQDQPALGLFFGDIVIVDRRRLPGTGDIALGNARCADGLMKTVLGRYLPPYLVTSETMSTGQAIVADGDSVALYHPVIASFRRIRAG